MLHFVSAIKLECRAEKGGFWKVWLELSAGTVITENIEATLMAVKRPNPIWVFAEGVWFWLKCRARMAMHRG